jgi:hypothetical protein
MKRNAVRKLEPTAAVNDGNFHGWIAGAGPDDRARLEALGIEVGPWVEDNLGGEFRDCVVSPEAMQRLDPLWPRFIWGLFPPEYVAKIR